MQMAEEETKGEGGLENSFACVVGRRAAGPGRSGMRFELNGRFVEPRGEPR